MAVVDLVSTNGITGILRSDSISRNVATSKRPRLYPVRTCRDRKADRFQCLLLCGLAHETTVEEAEANSIDQTGTSAVIYIPVALREPRLVVLRVSKLRVSQIGRTQTSESERTDTIGR